MAVVFEIGQRLEDFRLLAVTAFGGDDGGGAARGHQSHRALLPDEIMRKRSGNADGVFQRGGRQDESGRTAIQELGGDKFGGRVGFGVMHAVLPKVQKNPNLRLRVLLEFLDHQFAAAGGGGPVDAFERVAGGVLAHAGRVRRHIRRFAADGAAAGQNPRGGGKGRDLVNGGKHHQRFFRRETAAGMEQPKRVAADDGGGTQGKTSALDEIRARKIGDGAASADAREQARPARARQFGLVDNLCAGNKEGAGVADLEVILEHVPRAGLLQARVPVDLQPDQRQAHPQEGDQHDQQAQEQQACVDRLAAEERADYSHEEQQDNQDAPGLHFAACLTPAPLPAVAGLRFELAPDE